MTHEEAVGFLQESGWLQNHDEQIFKQGYKQGRKEAVKRVFCSTEEKTIEGFYDDSRHLVYISYITEEWLRHWGFDIQESVE